MLGIPQLGYRVVFRGADSGCTVRHDGPESEPDDDITFVIASPNVVSALHAADAHPTRPGHALGRALTQHGGAYDGAAGPVRAVSARTCDLLPAVARVARFLYPEMSLTDRVERILIRLELGAPSSAVAVARHTGVSLSRGDYLDLVKAGYVAADAIEEAKDEDQHACVDGDIEKLNVLREVVIAIRNEPHEVPALELPENEA